MYHTYMYQYVGKKRILLCDMRAQPRTHTQPSTHRVHNNATLFVRPSVKRHLPSRTEHSFECCIPLALTDARTSSEYQGLASYIIYHSFQPRTKHA